MKTIPTTLKANSTTLKIYWDDGVTIECRPFPSIRQAKKYAKNNGVPAILEHK